MAEAIKLTEDEARLVIELTTMLDEARKNEWKCDYDKLDSIANELHGSLAKRGLEPIHHKYMIKNRGTKPGTKGFYDHIHPVQDLLKFVKDPEANKDPEDKTLGEEFRFEVYTQRWGHSDSYKVVRTKSGWDISHIAIGGSCDMEGNPYLFKNLQQDYVSYPEDLGSFFWSIWKRAEDQGLSKQEVQAMLDAVSIWVSNCEKSKPDQIIL
ncbi:hypothetical protein [Bdellovibrio bacteriovorus]|uniref:hypothetical protein n=1 Tax=Bdellovibrio bacteriovorus TaxID=959 RepID=UPI0035A620D8